MADMHIAAKKAWIKRREIYGDSGISNPKRGNDAAKRAWYKRRQLYGTTGISKKKINNVEMVTLLKEMRCKINLMINSLE